MRASMFSLMCAAALSMAAPARAAGFQVSSDTLQGGHFPSAQVYSELGCGGGNLSPHLKWSGAPSGTKSFVVTVYDLDAPTGSGWWHWVVINLPAAATELLLGAGSEHGQLPHGALQIKNDYGKPGYGGPCPPLGQKHRYLITVNALKVEKLDLGANASPAMVGAMANASSLGKATLTATYGR